LIQPTTKYWDSTFRATLLHFSRSQIVPPHQRNTESTPLLLLKKSSSKERW
jgi:hypothetical protein